jgi:hypothetical protein
MKVIQLVAFALIVSLLGCTHSVSPPMTGNPDQDALNKNRALWKNAHLSTYTYTYKRMCFCPPEEDILVKVQYGNVVSASYSPSNNPVMPERLDGLKSIDEFFQVIQQAITNEVARLEVTYNPRLGYPERIYIDVDERMADEEMEHQVSNLH